MNERGFTLPELIVVAMVFLTGLMATLLILRPESFESQEAAAARRLGNAQIMQALREYKADHGSFPADFPSEATPIGSVSESYDLCALLVPTYLDDLPLDPGIGYKIKGTDEATTASCIDADVDYVTGYFITRANDGTVTVNAVDTETAKEYRLEQKL